MKIRYHLYAAALLAGSLLLGGCDSDMDPRVYTSTAAPVDDPGGVLNPDISLPADKTLQVNFVRLAGASADGADADLVFQYFARTDAEWQSTGGVYISVVVTDSAGYELAAGTVDHLPFGLSQGELVLRVPASVSQFTIMAYLRQRGSNRVLDVMPAKSITIPGYSNPKPTNLADVIDIYPEMVPNSYSSESWHGRLVHRFAVKVFDGPENDPYRTTITGLDLNPSDYFIAYENDIHDEESPVTASSRYNRVMVYFVLDTSYSIVLSGYRPDLIDAASRSVLALGSSVEFNYRQFAGDVRSIKDIAHLDFDEETSGTALYHALDTALIDIEQHGDPSDYKIIIAFTDGRDLSSRNYYPQFQSHSEVRDHIAGRLKQVKLTQESPVAPQNAGGGLETHIISLGSNVDVTSLDFLASAGGGLHRWVADLSELDEAFETISRRILSTYQLEYSSQQLSGDSTLDLEVVGVGSEPKQIRIKH